jgi:hypothetical protein
MLDQFGDGWDTSRLFLYDSYGYYDSYAPNCTVNKQRVDYCFPESAVNGDYVTIASFGFRPSNSWEVIYYNYNNTPNNFFIYNYCIDILASLFT